MFLRRLVIENFRTLRDLELTFASDGTTDGARQWTLLLGENGCGKSSVLRAIGLVLAGSEALPELLGQVDTWIAIGRRRSFLKAELATATGENREVSLTFARGDGIADVLRKNQTSMQPLDQALKHSARNYLTVGYGVSRRLSASAKSRLVFREDAFHHQRAQCLATLFNSDAVLNSLETWAMDIHYRKGSQGLSLVRDALKDLLPDVAFRGIDRKARRLVFDTPDGAVPLLQLSEGYQNVTAWCGDLLYRLTETFEDHRRPLNVRGLLLLDELELHLHPIWQRQLRTFLTKKLPNFQMVATTHSALTAQQAGAGELFIIRRTGPEQRPALVAYGGDAQKLMVHQVLLSQAFGLPTLDSPQVQMQRAEYRALKAKRRPTAREKRRLSALARELSEVPDWSRETTWDRKTRVLLQDLHRVLMAPSERSR